LAGLEGSDSSAYYKRYGSESRMQPWALTNLRAHEDAHRRCRHCTRYATPPPPQGLSIMQSTKRWLTGAFKRSTSRTVPDLPPHSTAAASKKATALTLMEFHSLSRTMTSTSRLRAATDEIRTGWSGEGQGTAREMYNKVKLLFIGIVLDLSSRPSLDYALGRLQLDTGPIFFTAQPSRKK